MSVMKRITLDLGTLKRKYVFTAPPFPAVGDRVTLGRQVWIVTKSEDVEGQVLPLSGRRKRVGAHNDEIKRDEMPEVRHG